MYKLSFALEREVLKKNLEILKKGGIGVILTDTIFGIVGSAFNKKTVERIYKIKKRRKDKPFIILISNLKDLEKFETKISKKEKEVLAKYWPGRYSIILPCRSKKFNYLHRGKKSLAFRMPFKKSLLEILKKTGPLVAPSANPESKKPAKSIREARKYFGSLVDFYQYHLKRGRAFSPSRLVKIERGTEVILRT